MKPLLTCMTTWKPPGTHSPSPWIPHPLPPLFQNYLYKLPQLSNQIQTLLHSYSTPHLLPNQCHFICLGNTSAPTTNQISHHFFPNKIILLCLWTDQPPCICLLETRPIFSTPPYLSANALVSGSSPRWEKLPRGYQNYPLKGLNLR